VAEARSVERVLKPTSIAVVGASRDPESLGHQVLRQLIRHRFNGPVYPVNREASFVASVRAWRSVVDLPGEVDLAVVCVPAAEVLRVVEECAVKRVQALVVLSSGFADQDTAGEELEAELVAYARRHGMRLLGPNTLGLINTDPSVSMHATFVPVDVEAGRVGLAAQSGVIGAAVADAARRAGVGISSFVAVGNRADVSSNDMLRYWQDDPATSVVMLYLESFGNPPQVRPNSSGPVTAQAGVGSEGGRGSRRSLGRARCVARRCHRHRAFGTDGGNSGRQPDPDDPHRRRARIPTPPSR
jgi:acyl-CoA synthetase (NDP forming)